MRFGLAKISKIACADINWESVNINLPGKSDKEAINNGLSVSTGVLICAEENSTDILDILFKAKTTGHNVSCLAAIELAESKLKTLFVIARTDKAEGLVWANSWRQTRLFCSNCWGYNPDFFGIGHKSIENTETEAADDWPELCTEGSSISVWSISITKWFLFRFQNRLAIHIRFQKK